MTIEELNKAFENVDEGKKQIIQTMFSDFIQEEELINQIKPLIKKTPKNQKEGNKFKFYLKLYNDVSQQHNNKIRIFLSTLNKFEGEDDDEFVKWLNKNK